jgi:hypothetical protein
MMQRFETYLETVVARHRLRPGGRR